MKTLSKSLKNLVKILNDGEFHSGSELGEKLTISRNAVWKHINQLEKYGVAIETVQSKGYRLEQPLIFLDDKTIKKQLNYTGKYKLKKIKIMGSIPSTQDYIKKQVIGNTLNPAICLAEHQTLGRGRFGRQWLSPFGNNVYLSYSWQNKKDVSKLSGLSLVVALAVAKALIKYGLKDLSIKWPNDILYQGKKLAGVLVEIRAESHGITQVIIGMGVNVNMLEQGHLKDRSWTSLQRIFGKYQDRNKIVSVLIDNLLQYLEDFDNYGFDYFLSQWAKYDHLKGKKIILHIDKANAKGEVIGINEQGHLLLNRKGKICAYSAGEASLSN